MSVAVSLDVYNTSTKVNVDFWHLSPLKNSLGFKVLEVSWIVDVCANPTYVFTAAKTPLS